MARTKPKVTAAGKAPALRVRTAAGTFRRGGMEFTATPVDILYESLSDEQVDLIKNEPRLFVQDIEVDVAAAADAGNEGK